MENRPKIYEIVAENQWENFLKSISNKKLVAFGATLIGEEILKYIPFKIDYYVDNDSMKWGKDINGVPIYKPDTLKSEKEEVAILITSSFFEEISKQIDTLNISNYMVINLDKMFVRLKTLFYFKNFEASFKKFVDNMPKLEEFKKDDCSKPIGVVVYSFMFTLVPWYFMTLASLLKYRGHDIIIIWDDVSEHSDMILDWNGATEYQNIEIQKSLTLVRDKLNIEVIKISDMETSILNEDDIEEVNRLAELNTIWKYRATAINNDLVEFKECYATKLNNNLKKIKSLFNAISFERIIAFTGINDCMGLYSWMGKIKKIDVGNCDFSARVEKSNIDGKTFSFGLISSNAPCTYFMDVKKIVEENMLEEDLKQKIINFGRNEFQENLSLRENRNKGVYQIISFDEEQSDERYDIIMPLNIGWDGAALGKNRFFSSIEEWVTETVEYILNHTSAKIAVRQHPSERNVSCPNDFFAKYNNIEQNYKSGEDLFLKLCEKFRENKRFRYIKGDEKINTYRLIEKAKLVLPHTSTVGLEAALMKKNVVVESDVYYGGIATIIKANSKEDYFNKIKRYCVKKNNMSLCDIETIQLVYGLAKFNRYKTEFSPVFDKWLNENVVDLLQDRSVKNILKVLGEGIPLSILQARDSLDR